jgi:hypothetical protein
MVFLEVNQASLHQKKFGERGWVSDWCIKGMSVRSTDSADALGYILAVDWTGETPIRWLGSSESFCIRIP